MSNLKKIPGMDWWGTGAEEVVTAYWLVRMVLRDDPEGVFRRRSCGSEEAERV